MNRVYVVGLVGVYVEKLIGGGDGDGVGFDVFDCVLGKF